MPEKNDFYPDIPFTKNEARSRGLRFFFTGELCAKGHLSPRYTKGTCVECVRLDSKSERFLEKTRKWRAENKRQMKHNNLKKFGISILDYEAILRKQDFKCAICRTDLDLHSGKTAAGPAVDHCHQTNRVRGILCQCCNRGIGLLKDSCEVLAAAILYLKEVEDCPSS